MDADEANSRTFAMDVNESFGNNKMFSSNLRELNILSQSI
jgi:hypothetical protein